MAEHLDEATIKSSLVPKIKAAALSESCTSAVKVSILVSLGMLVPRLDRWFIMDSVLDWVPKMIERTPGVLVASLGVYQTVLTNEKLGLTKEFIGKLHFLKLISHFHQRIMRCRRCCRSQWTRNLRSISFKDSCALLD